MKHIGGKNMPLPLFVWGLGALAAAVGIGANADAKETNERAQQIVDDAKQIYDSAKASLDKSKDRTERSLIDLGTSKKKVLDTSIKQFLLLYEQVKDVEVKDSPGLDEIKNFELDENGILQLQEMSNIYESLLTSGAAGAATGTLVALAASGNLSLVASIASSAGTALTLGEVGVSASLLGTAASFSAAVTPLAAVAAPIVLFTGISASMKADENLEKAQTMYAEAERAVEEMKVKLTFSDAIAKRSDMLNELLKKLDPLLLQCNTLLKRVIKKKSGVFNKRIDPHSFTKKDLELIAVSRAIAGAIKAIIDTPILTQEGSLNSDAETLGENTSKKLPALTSAVDEVKNYNYHIKQLTDDDALTASNSTQDKHQKLRYLHPRIMAALDIVRNTFALLFALFNTFCAWSVMVYEGGKVEAPPMLLAFSITMLLFMNNRTDFRFFRLTKFISCSCLFAGTSIIFYEEVAEIIDAEYYIVWNSILSVVLFLLFAMCISPKVYNISSFRMAFSKIFGCAFFFALSSFLFALLYSLFHLSYRVSIIISVIVYGFFALGCAFWDYANNRAEK